MKKFYILHYILFGLVFNSVFLVCFATMGNLIAVLLSFFIAFLVLFIDSHICFNEFQNRKNTRYAKAMYIYDMIVFFYCIYAFLVLSVFSAYPILTSVTDMEHFDINSVIITILTLVFLISFFFLRKKCYKNILYN